MSNARQMQVYVERHGCVPYARSSVAEFAHTFTTAVTVGRGTSPGTPVQTGEARGGWRIGKRAVRQSTTKAAFYAVLDAVVVDAFMKTWAPGDPVVWWNNVLHLAILAGGRRPDRNGRMIGSVQAEDGWIEQSSNETRAHMRGWHPSGRAKLQTTLAFAQI